MPDSPPADGPVRAAVRTWSDRTGPGAATGPTGRNRPQLSEPTELGRTGRTGRTENRQNRESSVTTARKVRRPAFVLIDA